MAGAEDEPATKRDLRELEERLEERLTARITSENASLEERLMSRMKSETDRLVLELSGVVARAVGVNREDLQKGVSIVDEKYQDLPRRVAILEADVAVLKAREPPPPAPPRRRTAKK